jgi:acid phosphatase family membrane protein YuiD
LTAEISTSLSERFWRRKKDNSSQKLKKIKGRKKKKEQ